MNYNEIYNLFKNTLIEVLNNILIQISIFITLVTVVFIIPIFNLLPSLEVYTSKYSDVFFSVLIINTILIFAGLLKEFYVFYIVKKYIRSLATDEKDVLMKFNNDNRIYQTASLDLNDKPVATLCNNHIIELVSFGEFIPSELDDNYARLHLFKLNKYAFNRVKRLQLVKNGENN